MKRLPPLDILNMDQPTFKEKAFGQVRESLDAAQFAPQVPIEEQNSIPITIIGGFLGAGKTTLLNHLLSKPKGHKLAVLVNDFGSINIDASLIDSSSAETISLTNGCACCSMAGDLSDTLVRLYEKDPPPDAIIIEASGLADPRNLARIALANATFRLNGLLILADAQTLGELEKGGLTRDIFASQLSAADIIILSKLDLLTSEEQKHAHCWIKARYPDLSIISSDKGKIDIGIALGILSDRDILKETSSAIPHVENFESLSLEESDAMDKALLSKFFSGIPSDIIRAKGVFNIKQRNEQMLFHLVGSRWSLVKGRRWGNEPRKSSLVLIGPKVSFPATNLKALFHGCIAKDNYQDR